MTDVIAWPPVGLTSWELTKVHVNSTSVGLIDGRRRTSGTGQRPRRVATAVVSGMADDDGAGAGYLYMLADLAEIGTAGSRHLVRVSCPSPLWHLASDLNLRNGVMRWTADNSELNWNSGNTALLWSDNVALHGEPRTDGGWPALRVEGLPKNLVVARPSEMITVRDGEGNVESSRVLTVARSDGQGNATIRVRDAFTLSGLVSIGDPESIVFAVENQPRAAQPASGDWGQEWSFREVFLDEYPDGWTERDPWR